ncbi:MAG: SGNH/GDSL hydrolase family protein [Alphaproteobacteria bacterium]|nr:SGNH/GDSL hydrolase family protein [Alphaproteobacteria bacterium]
MKETGAITMIAAVVLATHSVLAGPFSRMDVFGDSLSDPGNIGSRYIDKENVVNTAPYAGGRYSNGPVYAELLPGLLGIPGGGVQNFAVGGALSDNTNNNNTGTGTLPGLLQQVRSATGLSASTLNVVWIGGNDYSGFLGNAVGSGLPARTAIDTQITITVNNVVAAITTLAKAGGRNFLVANLPPMGLTPDGRALAGALATNAGSINQITARHNVQLAAAMALLRQRLGVTILVMDVNALFLRIMASPGSFGFTNVTDPCLTTIANITSVCASPASYLFWDGQHPTAATQAFLAQYMTSVITQH